MKSQMVNRRCARSRRIWGADHYLFVLPRLNNGASFVAEATVGDKYSYYGNILITSLSVVIHKLDTIIWDSIMRGMAMTSMGISVA